jgi:hypothetical protein
MKHLLGRLLCFLGLHDLQLIDVTQSFGPGGGVERRQCRRCGLVQTRHT